MAFQRMGTAATETEEMHLSRPIFDFLDHPTILRFRNDYQRHRLGYAKGAKGEVGAALREVEEKQREHQGAHTAPLPEGITEDEAESLLSPFVSFGADSPFAREEQRLAKIAKWRMEYQNFRSGEARGAAGSLEELAKGLSLRALKLLPVVQLAEVLKKDKEPATPEQTLPSPHLHFGAGKLSFGLVLEAMIRSGVSDLIIAQRQSGDFSPLVSEHRPASVPILVNGRRVCDFRVYRTAQEVQKLIEAIKEKAKGSDDSAEHARERHLVLTNDSSLLLQLASLSKSMSCSLGPAVRTALVPLLSQLGDKLATSALQGGYMGNSLGRIVAAVARTLPPKPQQVLLYACENDHGAVEKLREELNTKVRVLPCMVDRICASRHVCADKIEVEAEPYEGEIVVLDRPENSPPPPFGGPNVHAPKLKVDASSSLNLLLCEGNALSDETRGSIVQSVGEARSRTLLVEEGNRKGTETPASDPLLTALRQVPLLKEGEMVDKQKDIMWAWLAARCLHVLWEHDKEVIKRTHNIQTDEEVVEMLLTYGKKTLSRFSTVEDTAGRVLGGGVVNRFHTRLLTIYHFLEQHIFGSVPLASNLLKHANLSAFQMIDEVRRLVEEARIFVEK
ncbi:mannitol-1-phosphate dehydrogenase [Cyclospora cayetanensis]|uniref:Mannitol-1-phosphate dehydrogenase n=1 Tax=Cyclospora cayetanensis TaxID=88456 RepID=A0A1D3D0C9_9EIME|nr:mannitol-1-phosphate dehydrogenase [Cyclospora cayetanensis]